jgi:ubiquinol-cytochrome c reductase iron-sulfur subunit
VSHGDGIAQPPAEQLAGSIDTGSINKQRRYFLIGATAVVGAAGVVGAAVPFVASWSPSAKARALGAPATIDISKLQTGEMLGPTPAWRGQPIFVLSRTPESVETLKVANDNLADPESTNPKVQPEPFDPDWKGGFFCPCHGSRFDLAGRVVKSVPAPDNLPVPPYRFVSDTVVVIGEDEETA